MTILRKNRLTINALKDDERSFHDTLIDAHGKQWELKNPCYPRAIRLHCPKAPSYYYKKEHEKKRIVLHATHGYLSGDVANLSKHHVSTAYLIARNGQVYELFDPKYWSYHIGPLRNSWTTNTRESQQTIAIELSNMGDLREHETKPEILLDAWGFPYCMKENEQYYMEQEYKGHSYWATYTNEQYKSLDSLLLWLCRKYDILHHFLPPEKRMDLITREPRVGIVAHVNYRRDKVDVSPAFNWGLIKGR